MANPAPRPTCLPARLSIPLLLLLLAACQNASITRISEFPEPTRTVTDHLSVVTWNAQKGSNPEFREDLAALIAREQPDLVFLQEATEDLLDSDQLGGYFAGSWSYPWPGGKTIGMLSLSRVPPLSVQPMPSQRREFLVTAPKLSLLTLYPLSNGQQLLAVNVHLLAFERWGTRGIRQQLETLQSAIDKHRGPVLFLGDLNTWSNKRLTVLEAMIADLDLVEVTGFPPGRRTGAGRSALTHWLLGVDAALPLDRVYTRGLIQRGARLLPYHTSDHRPLLVDLRLAGDPVYSRRDARE